MDAIIVIGSLAAVCSTASFAPQAWKIVKSRDTDAISKRMYVVTVIGFALWLFYGLMKAEWPLIVANSICLALSTFILIMKILPPAKKAAVAKLIRPNV